ncbi:translation initiation factor IF-2-like [Talpa occidentalis]|uniref:translation initiation factor IF-2-like n=1 Tax=Talpa occidentalis TaxID=50954 RepID=UPI00188F1124|nr:translation initiation factor IF-2-like [Talpa occidentalis]
MVITGGSESARTRDVGAPAGHQSPSLASPKRSPGPHTLPAWRTRAPRPQASWSPSPGPPLPPILRLDLHPRTSQRGWLSPPTSCAAAGSESHPQVIPRALAAATAAAAAIRTGPSMHRAGRLEGAAPRTPGRGREGGRTGGLARGPGSPRTEPRAPGTRDAGEGSGAGGRSHPARPRGALLPSLRARARSPAGAGPARSTRGAGGGGPGRGGHSARTARAPPEGARAGCQISGGGMGRTNARRGDARGRTFASSPCYLVAQEATPGEPRTASAGVCNRPGGGALATPGDAHNARALVPLTLTSPERRHFCPVHKWSICSTAPAQAPPLAPAPKFSEKPISPIPALGSYLKVTALCVQLPAASGCLAFTPLSILNF